jgi:hypothetical protein
MKLSIVCATEHQEQSSFFAWLARFHPDVYDVTYHIPNGRTSAREGAKYKSIGARSGVPDVCMAFPRSPYHGLYFEFKRVSGGVVSDAQKEWIRKLNEIGYKAEVVYGWQDAKRKLEFYLGEQNMSGL